MALSSNAKSRSLLGKILPGKGESSSKKVWFVNNDKSFARFDRNLLVGDEEMAMILLISKIHKVTTASNPQHSLYVLIVCCDQNSL